MWVEQHGSGSPLLLVHGFPLHHAMWEGQWAGLADACRLIVPDLRGFGRSSVTPGTVTMQRMADDLAALLDVMQIPQPVTLCGLSMGGYVAMEFQRRHSQRMRAMVLCDTRAAADAPEAAANRIALADRVEREGTQGVVQSMRPKLLAASTLEKKPGLVAMLERMMAENPPQGIAAASRGMAQRADMRSGLTEIRQPTLVVVGAQDAISPPAEMRGIAEAIPQASVVEIPEAGHLSPMEQPEAVNAAIRKFLHELPSVPKTGRPTRP